MEIIFTTSLLFSSASCLIQRNFKIDWIPRSLWTTTNTFSISDYSTCSSLCLMNGCAAFSVSDGVCQLGVYSVYMPIKNKKEGKKVFIALSSDEDDGNQLVPFLNVTKVPHIAFFGGMAGGQQDFSLDNTTSPAITLAPPHPDFAGGCTYSYNFYSEPLSKFYMCSAAYCTSVVLGCYSWIIGDPAGFVREVGQDMLLRQINGAAVMLGDKFWVTGGTVDTSGHTNTQRSYTEYWQDGKWTQGPNLPVNVAKHTLAVISPTQIMLICGWIYGYACMPNTYIGDLNTGIWTQKASYPGSARCDSASGAYQGSDNLTYVVSVGGSVNGVLMYNVTANSWVTLPGFASPILLSVILAFNNQLTVWGGEATYSSTTWIQTVSAFVPQNNSWLPYVNMSIKGGLSILPLLYNY